MSKLDSLDLQLVLQLLDDPRAQIGGLSNALGIARNTAQGRIKRLLRSGILRQGGREIDVRALDYDVMAFVTIEVNHRELDGVITALRTQPQVLEAYEISGRGDVWCRVVATDTQGLQEVLRFILRIKGVLRTETELVLLEHIPYRAQPLLRGMAAQLAE